MHGALKLVLLCMKSWMSGCGRRRQWWEEPSKALLGSAVVNNQHVYKYCRVQAAAAGDRTMYTGGRASRKIIIRTRWAVSGQTLAKETRNRRWRFSLFWIWTATVMTQCYLWHMTRILWNSSECAWDNDVGEEEERGKRHTWVEENIIDARYLFAFGNQ